MSLPYVTLNGVTTAAPGTSIDLATGVSFHTMQVGVMSGNISAWTVNLEGSMDGLHWDVLATVSSTDSAYIVSANQHQVRFVRGNCTVLTSPDGTGVLSAAILSDISAASGFAKLFA